MRVSTKWLSLCAIALSLAATARGAEPACRELDARYATSRAGIRDTGGFFRSTLWLWVRAYQVVVSPGDGARCALYPTCSAYAARAVRSEGPVLGVAIAAARVMADHDDPALPACDLDGHPRRWDPPEEALWWARSRR